MGEEEGKVVMSREVLKTLTLMLRRQFMEAERTAPVTGRYKENIVLRDCPSSFTIHTILGFLSQLGDAGHLSNLASPIIMRLEIFCISLLYHLLNN